MINILIVEDEIPARNGLKYDVSRYFGSKAQIALAENGVEALRLAEAFHPNILLTDIRMPHMLGTQLAEKILELYPQCKIIFLSGYSDKIFLKLAIKLGVIDYIEKPIDTDDLQQALEKAVLAISAVSEDNNSRKDEILSALFRNKPADRFVIPEGCELAAAIISPCSEYITPVQTLIGSTAPKYGLEVLCRKKSTGAVELLFVSSAGGIRQRIDSFFKRFFIETDKSESFKCAVGSIERTKEGIYKSYQNAVITTDIAFFHPTNTVIYFDDVQLTDASDKKEDFNLTALSVYNALISGSSDEALRLAEVLFNRLRGTTQIFSSGAKEIYYKLFKLIMDYYRKFFSVSDSENTLLYSRFSTSDSQTLDDLHEHLLILIKLADSLPAAATDNISDLAILYLEQHYSEPNLSINDVVRFCRINTSQLCSSFKNATGHTINHYLTDIRIKHAKQLLIESDYKIDDISNMCGFNYQKYFFRVFKKHTLLTPSEYRKKFRGTRPKQ